MEVQSGQLPHYHEWMKGVEQNIISYLLISNKDRHLDEIEVMHLLDPVNMATAFLYDYIQRFSGNVLNPVAAQDAEILEGAREQFLVQKTGRDEKEWKLCKLYQQYVGMPAQCPKYCTEQ